MNSRLIILSHVLLSASAASGYERLSVVPSRDSLADTISESTHVAIARVVADGAAPDEGPTLRKAQLDILLPIKGDARGSVVILYDERDGRGAPLLFPRMTYLFFLHPVAGSLRLAADPTEFTVTAWPRTFGSTEPLDQVLEVSRYGAEFDEDSLKLARIGQLTRYKDRSAIPVLRKLLVSPNWRVRDSSLGALIRLGDTDAARIGIDYVSDDLKDATGQPDALRRPTLQSTSVISSLEEVRDPSLAPELQEAARHASPALRTAAARALREMRITGCIPLFVELLDDPEIEVRYEAVKALYEMAAPTPRGMPARKRFEEDEKPYREKWRRWYKDEGVRLYPPVKRDARNPLAPTTRPARSTIILLHTQPATQGSDTSPAGSP